MDRSKYETYLQDNNVLKHGQAGVWFFHDSKKEKAIQFSFLFNGMTQRYSSKPEKRIQLQTFPFDALPKEIPSILLSSNYTIMVNNDREDYAMTFILSIDE